MIGYLIVAAIICICVYAYTVWMKPSDPAHKVLALFPGKFKLTGATPEIDVALDKVNADGVTARYIEIVKVDTRAGAEVEFSKTMPGIKNKFGDDIRSVVAISQVYGSSTKIVPALLADRGLILPADSGPNDYWLWQLDTDPNSRSDKINISYNIATRVPPMAPYAVAVKS